MFRKLISFSISRPKVIVYFTAALVLLALVQFPRIKVDTDPENMLADDAPVRVFSREVKQEFALYDFIVLGIVNDNHKNGVFNVSTLKKVAQITDEIKKIDGVIEYEIVAPSTKDNVEQAGLGSVRFNWLMEEPPVTQEQALEIRRQAQSHPMFKDSVVSSNGKAVALYVPIEKKDISYEVSQEIKQIAAKFPGDEKFYVTGLPVAEDQFGAEMF